VNGKKYKLVTDFSILYIGKRERLGRCVCVCILLLMLTNILHYYVAFVTNSHYNEEKAKLPNHYLGNCSFEQKPSKKFANKMNQLNLLITCG